MKAQWAAALLAVTFPLTLRAQAPAAVADPRIKAALAEISAGQVQGEIEKLVSFENRNTLSAGDSRLEKRGVGIGAARQWIRGELERYARECQGCLQVFTDVFTQPAAKRVPRRVGITNVYGVLRGTDPVEQKHIVLVSGHYDSRNSDPLDTTGFAPGANDDASGTAVVLECARVLSRLRFPATIIFLAAAGEEQGLFGSRHFAAKARAQHWDIEAVLNNDIVGGDESPGQDPAVVRVFSQGVPENVDAAELRAMRALGGENDSGSRNLGRYLSQIARGYELDVRPLAEFRQDRYLRGGDQISFNQQGFPAVRLSEFRENFAHQHQNMRSENGIEYGDLPKFVNFSFVAGVARLNAAALAQLASAPSQPANVRLITKSLENESTLAWDNASDSRTTGYQVLWRSTSAADWEHAENFGKLSTVTLPVSKDNVIFAVEALDAAGHQSLPVVPVAVR
jgi:hypothetical protein